MKVLHLSFSKSGGAGAVASNLSDGLKQLGINSSSQHVTESDIRSSPYSHPGHTVAAGLDEYFVKERAFSNQVSFLRENLEKVSIDALTDNDFLHLHWTPGQIQTQTIGKLLDLEMKIVWTLHDMWPFTAGCHYSGNCQRYQSGCKICPAVKPVFRNLTSKQFQEKQRLFTNSRANLVFVAPSQWIAEKARGSYLLFDQKVEVIFNPVPAVTIGSLADRNSFRKSLGVGPDSFLVAFSASNLLDKRKNLAEVLVALTNLHQRNPELELVLLLIGAGVVPEAGSLSVKNVGFASRDKVNEALSASDVLVNFSRDENLSMAVIESLAVGTPVVALNSGGNSELVIDCETGFLVNSTAELENRLEELAKDPMLVLRFGGHAVRDFHSRFEVSVVTRKYLELYRSLANQ